MLKSVHYFTECQGLMGLVSNTLTCSLTNTCDCSSHGSPAPSGLFQNLHTHGTHIEKHIHIDTDTHTPRHTHTQIIITYLKLTLALEHPHN